MRTIRIFHPYSLALGDTVQLEASACHHLLNVLRAKVGTEVELFNGEGGAFSARLIEASRRRATAQIFDFQSNDFESPLNITLAQGVSKGDRMDFTIQKAVELGVTRIVPIITSRSQFRLNAERQDKRINHWRGVIVSACEQCGRNRLPELTQALDLADFIASPAEDGGIKFYLHPQSERSLLGIKNPTPHSITLLIGPEGGLEEREIEFAKAHGYGGLSLGPRVLRTETAGLTVLAALQTLWGDLG